MTTASERLQQRQVAQRVSLLLAELTAIDRVPFDRAISLARGALDRAYWGDLPDGDTGPLIELP